MYVREQAKQITGVTKLEVKTECETASFKADCFETTLKHEGLNKECTLRSANPVFLGQMRKFLAQKWDSRWNEAWERPSLDFHGTAND